MSFLGRIQKFTRNDKPVLRGRISKISIMKGGESSIVVRFGIDEPLARMLDQGSLIELIEVEKIPQKPKRKAKVGGVVNGPAE